MDILTGKTLLITGGTGSFGDAVARRFADSAAKEIRIFSRDEKKQDDMRRRYKSAKFKFYIGDVRSRESVDSAVRGADYIFHAAALKQVPSCEFFPMEAVRTNILGTENMCLAAIDHGVKKLVILSTDKAAYPINAMGISKAMAEKVAVAAARNAGETVICCTRYGNVLASRGSVVPLFIDQCLKNTALTVTDPQMTRFMMTLEESVDLVIYAMENGSPGDIYVQKSPSCRIGDLAVALKSLLKSEIPTTITGTRHGEKLYETLLTREEFAKAEDLGEYYRVAADNRDLNYDLYFEEGITHRGEYSSHNTDILDIDAVKELLLKLPSIREAIGRIT